MTKQRLSKNQKDALFVLVLLKVNGKSGFISLSKIRAMVESSRTDVLDPSNFRKGIHTLASRGLVEVARASDLSLVMCLTRPGLHVAAGIFRDRTGKQLDIKPKNDEQMTIFDNEKD